ncbi:suppressor of glycerol defect [Rhodotorula kratochvilovae]
MPPKPDYNFAARKRTATLPAKLRTELEQLGHLPPNSNKQRISRKDRRKQERNQPKTNRAQSRKRNHPGDGDADAAPPLASTGTAPPAEPAPKRTKVAPAPAPAEPAKKQTPLERLLAKQDRGAGPDPTTRKSKAATDEDREIAWLEAKLGLQRGLTSAEKGKMRGEFDEDGLGELFDTLGDLEGAAFGTTKKNYAKLLATADPAELDLPSDFDPAELEDLSSGSDEEDDDEAFGEYGIDDDELVDPSDDDDHAEMGELGSAESGEEEAVFDDGEEEEFGGISSGAEDDEDDEVAEEEAGPRAGKSVRFADDGDEAPEPAPAPAAAAPAAGKYVPPHLRKAAAAPPPPAAEAAPTPAPAAALDAPPDDPRLRRQLQGHLNKLSAANMGAIVDALAGLYGANPRAVVSASLTGLLLQTLADRDNLGEALVVTYAALVAALFRVVGVEFPAGVLTRATEMLDAALAKHADAAHGPHTADAGVLTVEEGFEGRPGSKEALNLVSFVAELYNLQVVHCALVYDLVRTLVSGGMGELEVELLSRIVKRSGQQLRSDDPSALKDIIGLVKQKMAGVDPSSMNSRTRFMVEQLTNLKNNKLKPPGADGAVDHHTPLRRFLASLNKKRASGAAPEPLRVGLAELRDAERRGKWWLVGAAWAGDPLAEHAAGGAPKSVEAKGDDELAKLARKQGMNTDVRKGVFNVLMSSEDYIDACERLQQLGLSDVQQREIARVLLQCCGNEKVYNPYYTLVGARLCASSHSFQITLQYLLWDFLRSLGEQSVGGEEMVKSLADAAASSGEDVPERKIAHTARFYAWCLAKGALPLTVLKPVPFGTTLAPTRSFLSQLLLFLILGTQTSSPAFALPAASTRKDREALERVLVKVAAHARLLKGLAFYVESSGREMVGLAGRRLGEREKAVVKWGVKVAAETLSVGGIVDV